MFLPTWLPNAAALPGRGTTWPLYAAVQGTAEHTEWPALSRSPFWCRAVQALCTSMAVPGSRVPCKKSCLPPARLLSLKDGVCLLGWWASNRLSFQQQSVSGSTVWLVCIAVGGSWHKRVHTRRVYSESGDPAAFRCDSVSREVALQLSSGGSEQAGEQILPFAAGFFPVLALWLSDQGPALSESEAWAADTGWGAGRCVMCHAVSTNQYFSQKNFVAFKGIFY